MQIIQMRLTLVTKKELRSVGILPLVRHGQHAPFVVLVAGVKFVGKRNGAPNGFTSLGARLFRRISRLDHEAFDIAMKGCAIVRAGCGQGEKVEGGARGGITEDLELQISNRRVNRHGHGVASVVYRRMIVVFGSIAARFTWVLG
jgi:hypothetical protein